MILSMMITVTVVGFRAVNQDDLIMDEWKAYKKMYRKHYESLIEDEWRKDIFIDNLDAVVAHNIEFKKGEYAFKMSMNHIGDVTPLEFEDMLIKFDKTADDEKVNVEETVQGDYYLLTSTSSGISSCKLKK